MMVYQDRSNVDTLFSLAVASEFNGIGKSVMAVPERELIRTRRDEEKIGGPFSRQYGRRHI